MPEIPHGYCGCGCGEKTKVLTHYDRHHGYAKGDSKRFVYGHFARTVRIVDRWEKKDRGYRTECWIWLLAKTGDGYGHSGSGGKRWMAHREVWEVEHGPVPPGMQLHHKCHQRDCVNPAHLATVTPAENVQKRKDGKLTMAKAREIRKIAAKYPPGRKPKTMLARRYGVSVPMIDHIVRNEAWREST